MTSDFKPRVSVGLPVYNSERYVAEAAASLLRQTCCDFELIISDNFSTHGTAANCRRLQMADPRVRYHRNGRNEGAAANFNRVVHLAEREFFAWANHDDVWHPTYLKRCLAELEAHPDAVLAYARSNKIDAEGRTVAPLTATLGLDRPSAASRLRRYHDLFQEVDRRSGWSEDAIEGLWTPVYGLIRRDALKRTGLIGSYISSDTVLLEELLLHGRFIEIEDELFGKRDHAGRSTRAQLDYDKRVEWFTGSRSGRFLFPRHRTAWERLRNVARAPIGVRARLSCLTETLAFYVRRSHEGKALVKELLINAGRLVLPPSRPGSEPQKW